MTREEAMCYLHNPEDDKCCFEKEIWAYEMAIKALEQEPRWISVSEKLPDIHNYSDNYLVTLKRGGIYIAMFTECDGKHWWAYDDVVAWIHLPNPYELQKSEE